MQNNSSTACKVQPNRSECEQGIYNTCRLSVEPIAIYIIIFLDTLKSNNFTQFMKHIWEMHVHILGLRM